MYVYVAVALLALLSGFTGGWKVQDWRYGAKEADRLEAQREQARVNLRSADAASETYEKAKAVDDQNFKVIYSEVEHVVEKPVYRDVCFDADGLRALSRAISPGATASEPAPAVPGPGATK